MLEMYPVNAYYLYNRSNAKKDQLAMMVFCKEFSNKLIDPLPASPQLHPKSNFHCMCTLSPTEKRINQPNPVEFARVKRLDAKLSIFAMHAERDLHVCKPMLPHLSSTAGNCYRR